jgi:hypothetical protein
MSRLQWLNFLQYVSIVTASILVVRMWAQGLISSYRYFFAFLAADLAGSIAGLVPVADPQAVIRFVVAQTIRTLLAAVVVFEIYGLALEQRAALALAGRRLVAGALLLGLLIAGAVLYLEGPSPPHHNAWVQRETAMETVVGSTELLLLCAIGGFLAWFPVRLRRNLAIYIAGFAGFFAIQWSTRIAARVATPDQTLTINVVSYILTQICTLLWIFALTREGERRITTTALQWSPERMGELQQDLDEINRDLERFVR